MAACQAKYQTTRTAPLRIEVYRFLCFQKHFLNYAVYFSTTLIGQVEIFIKLGADNVLVSWYGKELDKNTMN